MGWRWRRWRCEQRWSFRRRRWRWCLFQEYNQRDAGSSIPLVVGAAGTAGSTSGSNGGIGGTSSFGAGAASANGGNGGGGSTSTTPGAGGSGAVVAAGTTIFSGGNGAAGTSTTSSGGGGGSGGKTSNGNNASGTTAGAAVNWRRCSGAGKTTNAAGGGGANPGGGAGGAYRTSAGTAKAGGAGGNGKVVVTANCPTCYCTPSSTNGTSFGDGFTKIAIGNVTDNSLQNATSPYYTYNQSIAFVATAGVPVTDTITQGYADDIYMWIDLNGNGLFSDPGEQIFNAVTAATSTYEYRNVHYPGGNTTRQLPNPVQR